MSFEPEIEDGGWTQYVEYVKQLGINHSKFAEMTTGETSMVKKEFVNDPINSPSHYADGRKYEPIHVIRDWNLNFSLGNAVKYISRAGRKDPTKTIEDLKKAIFYIQNEISALEEK